MIYKVGRFLQLAGLLILPAAVAGNVAEKLSLGQSLLLSGAGMAVFFIGWLLQQAVKRP
jgi:hypothetical protein